MPTIAYQSPDGAVTVLRHGARQYERVVAGQSRGMFTACYQAQHATDAPAPALDDRPVVGQLPDGAPILGWRSGLCADEGTPITVGATSGDVRITLDADGYVALSVGACHISDETPLAALLRLRDVLNSGALEAMAAAAHSWLGAELATGAPVVRVERTICDDQLDARYGQETGTDYSAGTGADQVMVYFPDAPACILDGYLGENAAVPLEQLPAIHANLTALLSDPRVRAGIAAYQDEAAPTRRRRAQ